MAFAFLSSLYGDFMSAVGASVRIFELLDRQPASVQSVVGEGLAPNDIDASIVFEDVRFVYPSRPDSVILQQISFEVQPGTVAALVGASGLLI